MDLNWQDPPPAASDDRRSAWWRELSVELQTYPSKWAKVNTYKTRTTAAAKATRINKGEVKALGSGYEATHRTSGNGTWDLYVRFLGDERDEEEPYDEEDQ